jgi:hypothetical protein
MKFVVGHLYVLGQEGHYTFQLFDVRTQRERHGFMCFLGDIENEGGLWLSFLTKRGMVRINSKNSYVELFVEVN